MGAFQPARVVLVGLRALTLDILRTYIEPSGIEVVTTSRSHLVEIVSASRPDFIITDRDAITPHEMDDLLESHAKVRVLTVSGDCTESVLHQLRPTRTPLGGLTRNLLLNVLTGHRAEEINE